MSDDPDGRQPTEKDRVVGLLGQVWSSISRLLASLPAEAWSLPALPGWDVHDVIAHLVGVERTLTGAERPPARSDVGAGDHVRNDVARLNEEWVVALRDRTPEQLRADFDDVTARRLADLEQMGVAEFDAPSWTPVGQATYGRFMEVRVFDSWMHEQDVRVAAGVPGHEQGPVAEEALAEVVRALGYIVGKRGGAPDGSAVTIRLTGPIERELHVKVDGRAKVVDRLESPPTATLSLSSSLFFRLAGGRVDPATVIDQIGLGGDVGLARQLATHLAYTI